jgi:hypothetical protein
MRHVVFLIPALALACNETATAPPLGENASAAGVACNPASCGLAHVTLTATDIELFRFPQHEDPLFPPVAQFSCDSLLRVDRFVGTAIDDRSPQDTGVWAGQMDFSPVPLDGIPNPSSLDAGPVMVAGEVSFPDGRAWQGFAGALWTPTARTCDIVDDVMRIRIDAPGGFAMVQTAPPSEAGNAGSAAGFVSAYLDVAPDLSVLASSLTVRLLDRTDPASITLSVSNKNPPVGSSEVLTATVKDLGRGIPGTLDPVSGASVVFAITGASTTTLACTTDASGRCSVSYSGPAAPGRDSITVFADINGDGTLGLGEPSRVVELVWGDASPPAVSPHDPVVAEATGPGGAAVTFEPPTATDDVGVVGSVECNPPSGSLFVLGSTTVTCTAHDAAGNAGSSSFEVRVEDTTPPAISFSGNAGTYSVEQTVAIQCSATDLVTASPDVTCTGGSGPAYSFDAGANEVTASAVDDAGNESSASTTFVVDVTVGGICRLARSWSRVPNVPLCKPLEALTDRLSPAQRAHLVLTFIHVLEQHSGKTIPSDKADILIRLAGAL